MNSDQRRAHLILQGLPLMDEWLTFCDAWDTRERTRSSAAQYAVACIDWYGAVRAHTPGSPAHSTPCTWRGRGGRDCLLMDGSLYMHPTNLPGEAP